MRNRKRNRKRITRKTRKVAVLLILALVMPLVCAQGGTAGADSLYVKKVVSVVYDDSGSMTGADANWAYANYAMQAFCALLNEDDQMYITFMSDCYNTYDFSARTVDPQKAVDTICAHSETSGTPYDAVETAINKLLQVGDYDDNTQFWLVVFTDGEFYSDTMDTSGAGLDNIIRNRYMNTAMPNGSRLYLSYFGIGSQANVPTEDTSERIFVSTASGSRQIFDELSKISHMISGRYDVDPQKIRAVDGKTVEVSSDIALLNIVTLLQRSDARLEKIECVEGELEIKRQTLLKTPAGDGNWMTDYDLHGATSMISAVGGAKIPPGTYRMTFSEDIDPSLLNIMFEPAIYIKTTVTKEGIEVTDLSELYEGDTIDISCKICELGTDNEIDSMLLPGTASYTMTVSEDNNVSASVASPSVSGVTLSELPTVITSKAEIEGIAPVSSVLYITPSKMPVIELEAVPESGLEIDLADIRKNEEGISFYILINGQHATPVQAAGREIEINSRLRLEITKQDDGSWLAVPKGSWPLMFVPKGEIPVTGELNGAEAEAVVTVTCHNWLIPIIDLLWPPLLLLLIVLMLLRKRFHMDQIEVMSYRITETDDIVEMGGGGVHKRVDIFTDFIGLLRPCREKFSGVTFVADSTIFSPQSVIIPVKNLSGKVFCTSQINPRRAQLKGIARRLRSSTPEKCAKQYPEDIVLTGNALVVLSGTNTMELYRMKSDVK